MRNIVSNTRDLWPYSNLNMDMLCFNVSQDVDASKIILESILRNMECLIWSGASLAKPTSRISDYYGSSKEIKNIVKRNYIKIKYDIGINCRYEDISSVYIEERLLIFIANVFTESQYCIMATHSVEEEVLLRMARIQCDFSDIIEKVGRRCSSMISESFLIYVREFCKTRKLYITRFRDINNSMGVCVLGSMQEIEECRRSLVADGFEVSTDIDDFIRFNPTINMFRFS